MSVNHYSKVCPACLSALENTSNIDRDGRENKKEYQRYDERNRRYSD
jgi:hypothetical protein